MTTPPAGATCIRPSTVTCSTADDPAPLITVVNRSATPVVFVTVKYAAAVLVGGSGARTYAPLTMIGWLGAAPLEADCGTAARIRPAAPTAATTTPAASAGHGVLMHCPVVVPARPPP